MCGTFSCRCGGYHQDNESIETLGKITIFVTQLLINYY